MDAPWIRQDSEGIPYSVQEYVPAQDIHAPIGDQVPLDGEDVFDAEDLRFAQRAETFLEKFLRKIATDFGAIKGQEFLGGLAIHENHTVVQILILKEAQ